MTVMQLLPSLEAGGVERGTLRPRPAAEGAYRVTRMVPAAVAGRDVAVRIAFRAGDVGGGVFVAAIRVLRPGIVATRTRRAAAAC